MRQIFIYLLIILPVILIGQEQFIDLADKSEEILKINIESNKEFSVSLKNRIPFKNYMQDSNVNCNRVK